MVGVQGERKADICGEISSVPRQWVASREEPLRACPICAGRESLIVADPFLNR